MTENQSNALVKNPNTKKAITVLKKFAQMEAEYKALEKESKAATELIKEAMIERDMDRIEIDVPGLTGYITLAERTSYKAEDIDEVPDEFLKPTLDTEKVKAQAVLTGQLPTGVSETKTQYITKKLKVSE
jgi:autotransporter translocation and assembly factor TamB